MYLYLRVLLSCTDIIMYKYHHVLMPSCTDIQVDKVRSLTICHPHPGDKTCRRHPGDKTCRRHAGDKTCRRHAGDKTCRRHAGDETCRRHAGNKTCRNMASLSLYAVVTVSSCDVWRLPRTQKTALCLCQSGS